MNLKLINGVIDNIGKNDFVGAPSHLPLPKEWVEKMLALGKKYRSIRWLPLDIPKFELDDVEEFKDIWNKESIDILRVKPDAAEPWSKEEHPLKEMSSWNYPGFRGLHLYVNDKITPLSHQSFCGKVYEGTNKQYKRILEQAFDHFPMSNMFSVWIWQSTREIGPHRDKGFFWECPTEFRAMLHDENEKPTLYVADCEHRDAHYVDCPDDTNSFCWSNGTQVHGSDYHGKKKWILCLAGAQHSTKSDELFSRSIRKYKDKLNYDLQIDL